jgi:membrane associated rhomboid family serine protease
MHPPPPLTSAHRYPVSVFIALAALAATLSWWAGRGIDTLLMNEQVWERWQLWRAVTSTLLHVNILHLAFNLYWFWVFGTILERGYGHLWFAGIVLFLAATSSFAEFTILQGGVGLSGVGYGLWAMLWVLERHDPRFAGAVDRQTTQLFVGWFFLCIVLTVTNVMPVANIAHATGAAAGALLGAAVTSRGSSQWYSIAAAAALLMMSLAGSTFLWPRLNISSYAGAEIEHAGVEAMYRSDNQTAAKLLEQAVRLRHAPARAWFNLGVAYQRLHREADALAAYQHAAGMPDADAEMRQAAQQMKRYVEAQKAARDILGK